MSKLCEKYQIAKKILKCDYNRYSPSEISTINTANSQICINIPREIFFISLLKRYVDLNFDVLHAASNNTYVDGDDIWLINLAIVAFFSYFKLTTSSGKLLEKIDHAHVVSLMYKLLTSSRGSDDLSIGFDRDRGRRQQELTNNKNIKGKHHVRILLNDRFGFAEHQDKAIDGLGFNLIITRNSDNAGLKNIMQPPLVKLKLILLIGLYLITHPRLIKNVQ